MALHSLFSKYISGPHVCQIHKFLLKSVITCAFSSLLAGCMDSLIEKKNNKNKYKLYDQTFKATKDFGIKTENIE